MHNKKNSEWSEIFFEFNYCRLFAEGFGETGFETRSLVFVNDIFLGGNVQLTKSEGELVSGLFVASLDGDLDAFDGILDFGASDVVVGFFVQADAKGFFGGFDDWHKIKLSHFVSPKADFTGQES